MLFWHGMYWGQVVFTGEDDDLCPFADVFIISRNHQTITLRYYLTVADTIVCPD